MTWLYGMGFIPFKRKKKPLLLERFFVIRIVVGTHCECVNIIAPIFTEKKYLDRYLMKFEEFMEVNVANSTFDEYQTKNVFKDTAAVMTLLYENNRID